jgi:DNA repair exonuclease SbcCD ATPase subunit
MAKQILNNSSTDPESKITQPMPEEAAKIKELEEKTKDEKCPICGKTFAPETDADIYPAKDRYHGTMYDGWICLFHLTASDALAGMDVEVDAEQDRHLAVALAEDLAQAAAGEDDVTHSAAPPPD